MNTKLATSRMRTGQWADIIKDCKESGLKVDDYCAQHGLSKKGAHQISKRKFSRGFEKTDALVGGITG